MKYVLLILFLSNSPGVSGNIHIETAQVPMATSEFCEAAKSQVLDGRLAHSFKTSGIHAAKQLVVKAECLQNNE